MALLLEYIFQPEFQEILDDLGALFGVRAIFLSPAMEEVRVGQARTICPYCRMVQQELALRSACVASDRAHCLESARRGEVVLYRCHAGLTEAVAPISVDDLLLGFVMIGQFRTSSRPPEAMVRRMRRAGASVGELARAFEAAPLLERDRMQHVIRIFGLLSRFVARLHLVGVAGRGTVHPLLRQMAERPEAPLSLDEAAAMVHRSRSTVSHQFRRTVGRGFKRTQIELRLKRAEQYLREHPEMQVSEVAARVGYANAHYFSRLFRRHRGRSPSACRREARADPAAILTLQ